MDDGCEKKCKRDEDFEFRVIMLERLEEDGELRG